MKHISVRPADSIEQIVDTYGNMLFRLCLLTLGNASDAEDAVQETFIRYFQKAPLFENPEHEKAWLMDTLMGIPEKFRLVLLLYYVEEYSIVSIMSLSDRGDCFGGYW